MREITETMLFRLEQIRQAGISGAEMMAAHAREVLAAGLAERDPASIHCGCCRAIYRLTRAGRKAIERAASAERRESD